LSNLEGDDGAVLEVDVVGDAGGKTLEEVRRNKCCLFIPAVK